MNVFVLIISLLITTYTFTKQTNTNKKLQIELNNLIKKEQKNLKTKNISIVITNDVNKSIIIINPKIAKNYFYEPGSIMMPIVYSLLLKNRYLKDNTKIGVSITIGKNKIVPIYAKDVVINSSARMMAIISKRLPAKDFYNGLIKYGFNKKFIPDKKKLEKNIYKIAISRGYGLLVNLLQLTKIYSNFDTDNQYKIPLEMKKILIKTFEKKFPKFKSKSLIIGGKTGISRIINNYHMYSNQYNITFLGFVNDNKNHKYTIGILISNPKIKKTNPPSYILIPILKNIITILIKEKYITL
jgi:hypothetical protein